MASDKRCFWFRPRVSGAFRRVTNPSCPNPASSNSMTSVVEVRVWGDRLAIDDDEPNPSKKPQRKAHHVSFAKSTKSAAGVYATSKPPSAGGARRGNNVPTRNSSVGTKTLLGRSKASAKGIAHSSELSSYQSYQYFSPDDSHLDPSLKLALEDVKAQRALHRRYKAALVESQRTGAAYRDAAFRAKAEVAKLGAALIQRTPDGNGSVKQTLGVLDREKKNLREMQQLKVLIEELRAHKETLARARAADRRRVKSDEAISLSDLLVARDKTRLVKIELGEVKEENRVLTLTVRALERTLTPKAQKEREERTEFVCVACRETEKDGARSSRPNAKVDSSAEPIHKTSAEGLKQKSPEATHIAYAGRASESVAQHETPRASWTTKPPTKEEEVLPEDVPQQVVLVLCVACDTPVAAAPMVTEPGAAGFEPNKSSPEDSAVPLNDATDETEEDPPPEVPQTVSEKTEKNSTHRNAKNHLRQTVASRSRAGTLY